MFAAPADPAAELAGAAEDAADAAAEVTAVVAAAEDVVAAAFDFELLHAAAPSSNAVTASMADTVRQREGMRVIMVPSDGGLLCIEEFDAAVSGVDVRVLGSAARPRRCLERRR